MKLTIKDIAARCNVGKSTVSRVLNNDPKVSVQTRERVQAVIDELGFQPNQSARAMRGLLLLLLELLLHVLTPPLNLKL
ncbi:LacI family DNA-binding transcriptional regulator [Actinobacillus suis]|uniref:LacI family DNA-binding transcriptional regulator n=1 Tax=Actinobacillus suis TaxID=716 RepID=UPI00338F50AF